MSGRTDSSAVLYFPEIDAGLDGDALEHGNEREREIAVGTRPWPGGRTSVGFVASEGGADG